MFTEKGHRLIKRLHTYQRPLPFPTPYRFTSGVLFTTFCLHSTSYPSFSKKLQGILKYRKTQFEETEKASEPDQIKQGCWNYQTMNFKRIVINILKVVMEKTRHHARTDG